MGCDGVTVDLGNAIDGLLDGALANVDLGAVRQASTPAACAEAGGVVRRVGPFASPAQRERGFVCAVPPPMGHRNLRGLSLGDPEPDGGLSAALNQPIPFVLGATLVPGVVGFGARVLGESKTLHASPLLTRGIALVATGAGVLLTGHPFFWGAAIGQVASALDVLAESAADSLMQGPVPIAPAGGVKPLAGLSSAEAYAERAAAGQVTAEDIADMQRLKQELTGMRGVSDQRKSGTTTGDARLNLGRPAAESTPTRFR